MANIIKYASITLVLVFLARIAGRRYDSYLIGIFGASQTAIIFLSWVIGAWASFVNWWQSSFIYQLFS